MTKEMREQLKPEFVQATVANGITDETEVALYSDTLLDSLVGVPDDMLSLGLMLHMLPPPEAFAAAAKAIGKTEEEVQALSDEAERKENEEKE